VKHWSIRVRITVWVAGVLGLVLVLLSATMWWTLRESVADTIDQGLAVRADAIGRFLNQPGGPASVQEMQDDLREYVALDPGWNLIRISDAGNGDVYRSPGFDAAAVASLAAPLPSALPAHLQGGKYLYRDVVMNGRALRMITTRLVTTRAMYTIDVAMPVGDLQEAFNQFRWTALVVLPVGILAAALGGYWISRRALAPVDRLASTARGIAAPDLGRRLEVPATGDELQRLSETLNAMLDRLEASFRETSRFTADASHELRTPLSLIRTSAELALRRDRSVDEYREALTGILRESERTTGLVQDLLTLARADAGVAGIERHPIDLAAVILDLRDTVATMCAGRQLECIVDVPPAQATVSGDAAALRRLLLILADNAVKYTPPPGRVTIALDVAAGRAVVQVNDTGIGISTEDLPHVFERFYRADKARTRESGGAGLGLSIARWIAAQHGGTLTLESAPGAGCRARFEMPLT